MPVEKKVRKVQRGTVSARAERPRRELPELPDFVVRLFGMERLKALETPLVLQHWHD